MLSYSIFGFSLLVVSVVSSFYGSMTGYACNQPSLYQGCNCQSLCQPYTNPHDLYYQQGYGCQGHCSGMSGCGEDETDDCGMKKRRKHRKKKKKSKKKKFQFSEEEENTVVDNESHKKIKKPSEDDDDEFPLPPNSEEVEEAAKSSKMEDKDWEDDEKWERKFVSQKTTTTARPIPAASGGLGGLGLGNGGLFGISSGVGVGVPGVGPIGVSSGLGIG